MIEDVVNYLSSHVSRRFNTFREGEIVDSKIYGSQRRLLWQHTFFSQRLRVASGTDLVILVKNGSDELECRYNGERVFYGHTGNFGFVKVSLPGEFFYVSLKRELFEAKEFKTFLEIAKEKWEVHTSKSTYVFRGEVKSIAEKVKERSDALMEATYNDLQGNNFTFNYKQGAPEFLPPILHATR